VTAPAPAKLIPKGRFGISVWVSILLGKYLFQQPTYRLLLELQSHWLDIAQGTVTDGMKRLVPLFEPIVHGILARNLEEQHWHADETRWLVFEEIEGKEGHRWYLWVFRSPSSVIYRLDPTRCAAVAEAHFGTESEGIISADRYGAYKSVARSGRFRIAFCWAHVRRDFIALGKDHPEHREWAEDWLERIGALYACNARRLEAEKDSRPWQQAQASLQSLLSRMAELREIEFSLEKAREKRKVLKSLGRHWEGLSLFVDHPHIPMDNNEAERLLRNPVVGRKNYHGSNSLWSGQLAAALFSIFQTLLIWGINPRLWLTRYLEACAPCGGEPPSDARRLLPWNLSEQERCDLGAPPNDTS
jgi:transposase